MILKIVGEPVNDEWLRFYGLAIDKELDPTFWKTQPHLVRKTVSSKFTDTVTVPDTAKYAVVGISADGGYYWHVKVYKDGSLIAEGDVARPTSGFTYLRVNLQEAAPPEFTVLPQEPTVAPISVPTPTPTPTPTPAPTQPPTPYQYAVSPIPQLPPEVGKYLPLAILGIGAVALIFVLLKK